MEVQIRESGDVKIVDIIGSLNTTTSTDAEAELNSILAQGTKKILINCEKLEYIASSGLRIIMATGIKLDNTGGEVRLCSLNEIVKEVFVMSSLDEIYGLYDDEQQALVDF